MTQVNPPFLVRKLRPKGLSDEMNAYFDQIERFNEQIYARTGGQSDSVGQSGDSLSSPLLLSIQNDIEPNPFTIDSTGWTIDNTQIRTDWVEA